MKNQALQTRTQTANNLRTLAESPAYQNRFRELLRDRAPQFVASLVQLVNGSQKLQECDPNTVIAAAITAAALDLPIEKNLGFAHIVPYSGSAAFQMGYKGYIQLAIRTGQYRSLNACVVYDGELISANKLTGDVVIDPTQKTSETAIGYAAYFRLVTGFEHAEYWTREEVEAHARRFSQAYSKGWETPWKTDFDAMALKTVIKDLLSHWGIMSVQLQKAIVSDVMVVTDKGEGYPDNPTAAVGTVTAVPNFEAGATELAPKAIAEPPPTPEPPKPRTQSPAPHNSAKEPREPSVAPKLATPAQELQRPAETQQEQKDAEAEPTFEQIVDGEAGGQADPFTGVRAKMAEVGVTEPQLVRFYNENKGGGGATSAALSDIPIASLDRILSSRAMVGRIKGA